MAKHKDKEIAEGAKRVRASLACTACNKRKAKCDAEAKGNPCSGCIKYGTTCEMLQSRRGKHPRVKKPKENDTSTTASESAGDINVSSAGDTTLDNLNMGLPDLNQPYNEHNYYTNPLPPVSFSPGTMQSIFNGTLPSDGLDQMSFDQDFNQTGLFDSTPVPQRLSPPSVGHSLGGPSTSSHTSAARAPSIVESMSSRTKATPGSPELQGAEILVDLLKNATQTNSFTIHNSRQMTYLPETSTLGSLVRQFLGTKRVHFSAPEVSESALNGLESQAGSSITEEHLQSLRKAGCFDLPSSTELIDALLSAYFTYLQPSTPVIDEVDFNLRYHRLKDGGVPVMLLWSMLFAGSSCCPMDILEKAGFSSRSEAMARFYDKAKLLCDADFGEDRVVTVQSMLLIGQNWKRHNNLRDSYFYVSQAIAVAQTLGMHRSTSRARISDADRRLWKRIWWCCVLRDTSTAGGIGRPFRIQFDFCDVEVPSIEDLETVDGSTSITGLRFRSYSSVAERRAQALYFIEMCKATEPVYEALRIQVLLSSKATTDALKARQAACHNQLASWQQALPVEMQPGTPSSSVWSTFLNLAWNLWTLYLFRLDDSKDAQAHTNRAAASITRLVEDLLERDDEAFRKLPGYGSACIFGALAQHAATCRGKSGDFQAQLAQNRLQTCVLAAKALGSIRPAAGWFLNMYLFLEQAAERIQHTRPPSPEPGATTEPMPNGQQNFMDWSTENLDLWSLLMPNPELNTTATEANWGMSIDFEQTFNAMTNNMQPFM